MIYIDYIKLGGLTWLGPGIGRDVPLESVAAGRYSGGVWTYREPVPGTRIDCWVTFDVRDVSGQAGVAGGWFEVVAKDGTTTFVCYSPKSAIMFNAASAVFHATTGPQAAGNAYNNLDPSCLSMQVMGNFEGNQALAFAARAPPAPPDGGPAHDLMISLLGNNWMGRSRITDMLASFRACHPASDGEVAEALWTPIRTALPAVTLPGSLGTLNEHVLNLISYACIKQLDVRAGLEATHLREVCGWCALLLTLVWVVKHLFSAFGFGD